MIFFLGLGAFIFGPNAFFYGPDAFFSGPNAFFSGPNAFFFGPRQPWFIVSVSRALVLGCVLDPWFWALVLNFCV